MGDYMTINGRRCRVAADWRAIVLFLRAKGTDSMAALADLGTLSASDMSMLMAACLNEGARLDGQPEDFTTDIFDTMAPMEVMTVIGQFLTIYAAQTNPQVPSEDTGKKKE